MIIYPNIQVMGGACVNLRRGDFDDVQRYSIAPLDAAKKIVEKGAEWLHLSDIDGIKQGGEHNGDTISEIMKAVSIPCQVAGGIRTMASAEWWLEAGAARIVLGTAAVKDPSFVREAATRFPGKVAVAIDALEGQVVIEGWREKTTFNPIDLAKSFEQMGVSALIYTDVDMDHELPDASFANTTQLAKEVDIEVISSGTVRTLDDIATLKHLPHVKGAVIGRAMFNNTIDLSDALAVAAQKYTKAPFI